MKDTRTAGVYLDPDQNERTSARRQAMTRLNRHRPTSSRGTVTGIDMLGNAMVEACPCAEGDAPGAHHFGWASAPLWPTQLS